MPLWAMFGREPRLGRKGRCSRRILDRMDSYWVAVLWSLLPTVVISALFFFVLRSVIRADRNERRQYARIDAEERAKLGLPPRADVSAASGEASAPAAGH